VAFYVSAIQGEKKALVLGPFRTHGEALALKFWASVQAGKLFKDADHFRTLWGTAHDRTQHAPGVLNPHVDLTLSADGYIEKVATG
jgi:hypothetical protein